MEQVELFTVKIVRKPRTEEEKEKSRKSSRKWYASRSEEHKQRDREKKREYQASMSEEQKEKQKKWKREYDKKREASLDLDQRRNRKIGYMYSSARRRAKDKELPFNLIKQDVADAWPKDDYCPALRIPLRIRIGNKTSAHITDNSPNLDRIIPRLGYVKGNIAVVSKLANGIMSSARPSEVIKVGKWFDEKYYEVKDKLNV